MVAPFDSLAGNRPASEKVQWSDESIVAFKEAQKYLSKACTITMPRRSNKLWIVLDATTKGPAVGTTLCIDRGINNFFRVAGFFSGKVKGHQIDWLPCEREALAIASAIKYFQPFIVQSDHQVVVLTDNKPCVQAFAKLQKGEFSASPRVSTFLSTCHRFQVTVQHISGVDNLLSDHQSRNPIDCVDSSCQICRFITDIESSVVREISVQDVISGMQRLPFLSRSAWKATQFECADLRRVHAHSRQGTRPSKKLTKIKHVKRYLHNVTIAADGLLVVRNDKPSSLVLERIVIPRSVLDGLLTSLHLKLNHPTHNQLKLVTHRYFFALDLDSALDRASTSCPPCASLSKLSHHRIEKSSSDPPASICSQFAADSSLPYVKLSRHTLEQLSLKMSRLSHSVTH